MTNIGLAEVIRALRSELEEAMTAGQGERLRFEANAMEVEFQVGVTRSVDARAGVKFWVFEVDAGGSHSVQDMQRLTLSLTPTLEGGEKVKIAKGADVSPLAGAEPSQGA